MKELLMILICLPLFGIAQKHADTLISLPMKDGKIFYDKIYQDSGFSKDELFIKANNVFLRLFPATKDVIQNEDKENGILSGKGNFSFNVTGGMIKTTYTHPIKTTISIIARDSRYKLEIFDFYLPANPIFKNDEDQPLETFYNSVKAKKRNIQYKYFIAFNQRVLLLLAQINDEMGKKLSTDF